MTPRPAPADDLEYRLWSIVQDARALAELLMMACCRDVPEDTVNRINGARAWLDIARTEARRKQAAKKRSVA